VDDQDENVIAFKPRPSSHPVDARMAQINKILKWSTKMYRAGHMPEDVAKAFTDYFGDLDGGNSGA
jgi:hypothetical protein